MVNKILKIIFALPILLAMMFIMILNIKITYRPGIGAKSPIIKELRAIGEKLDDGADVEMQQIYPEGYVFLNAIYSLAWSNFLQDASNETFMDEGLKAMDNALLKMHSETGKEAFNEELPLPYGAFYNGWTSYVLGSKLKLEKREMRTRNEVEDFKRQCELISISLQGQTYPVSYTGGAWPADASVCVASLALHDKLFKAKYESVIEGWVSQVKRHLDSHGMIPHSVHYSKGTVLEGARGSSLALMLIFMREIDESFAATQFHLFKSNFIDTKFGLTGVREYPLGRSGFGDVDSGPVILGFGGAATIVGMQPLSLFGEQGLSLKIRNTVEGLAFGIESNESKNYLFGTLPIVDAFIAWSHTSMDAKEMEFSFTRFRIYSALIFALLSILFWIFIADEKPDSKKALNVGW